MMLYPCDLLFVHRDAEKESYDFRRQQVEAAVDGGHHVPVIPVRMSEAWLLHEEAAIRRGSGNPVGRTALELPQPKDVEALVDDYAPLLGVPAFDRLIDDVRNALAVLEKRSGMDMADRRRPG